LAPVHAVRGNVDHGAWSGDLPVTQRIEIDGFRIYVLHILAELDPQAADNVDAVIYGHSHQPKIETKNGTLFFNPGSAGPRRFRLPITVGRVTAEHSLEAPIDAWRSPLIAPNAVASLVDHRIAALDGPSRKHSVLPIGTPVRTSGARHRSRIYPRSACNARKSGKPELRGPSARIAKRGSLMHPRPVA